ncbi:MAG: BMP family ABC transporter substrate-binding protein [Candidatus Eremiobacteraeota bacterium]|nr:BMP family ABC transporter substrate-binding protein [Candidatus Eremiobacteraeota bacterium]
MKMKPLGTFLLLAVCIAALAACGHRAGQTTKPGQFSLGMVTDTGGLGDKSFNDSAYAGLERAKSELGAHIQVLQSRSAADYQPNLTTLTNIHPAEIYAVGNLMAKDLDTVAKQNPKQDYTIIDAIVADPNVASVTFKEEDGSFLAGALAALVSKSHHIAFLGGLDIPLLVKFEAGFAAGAHQIDPSTTVDTKYVGSFDDVASGKELAGLLYSGGADIIYAAAGKAGLGAIDAVKNRQGDYLIGVDSNQDGLLPGKVLTSMVKHVDVAVFNVAQSAQANHPTHGHVILGLKDHGISLTDFQYTRSIIGAANIARVNRLAQAIENGRIHPPSTRAELAAFKPVKL